MLGLCILSPTGTGATQAHPPSQEGHIASWCYGA